MGMGDAGALPPMDGGLPTEMNLDTLGDLARAVADALVATGLNGSASGAGAVRVTPQPDGYYRCLLEGATTDESQRFAEALDQLVTPLWDPRWIIPRPVLETPPTVRGAGALALRLVAGRVTPGPQVWHAVPDLLATRQDRVAAFETAWRRWVAPGAIAIRERDPRGAVVLALRRGDDPFRTETQLRTLWT